MHNYQILLNFFFWYDQKFDLLGIFSHFLVYPVWQHWSGVAFSLFLFCPTSWTSTIFCSSCIYIIFNIFIIHKPLYCPRYKSYGKSQRNHYQQLSIKSADQLHKQFSFQRQISPRYNEDQTPSSGVINYCVPN